MKNQVLGTAMVFLLLSCVGMFTPPDALPVWWPSHPLLHLLQFAVAMGLLYEVLMETVLVWAWVGAGTYGLLALLGMLQVQVLDLTLKGPVVVFHLLLAGVLLLTRWRSEPRRAIVPPARKLEEG